MVLLKSIAFCINSEAFGDEVVGMAFFDEICMGFGSI